MRTYADTNFFPRLYLPLKESAETAATLEKGQEQKLGTLPVTWLHQVEVANAFQFYVFTGKSGGQRITQEQAAAAYATFQHDVLTAIFLEKTFLNLERLEAQAIEISLRHTAKLGFRTYDILHVCSALQLNCDQFWSFDPKACKLAALEGLKILPAGKE